MSFHAAISSGTKKGAEYCRYGCGYFIENYPLERAYLFQEHYEKAHPSEREKEKQLFNSSRQVTMNEFRSEIKQYGKDGNYFGKPVRIETENDMTISELHEFDQLLKQQLKFGLHPDSHPLHKSMFVLVSPRTCQCKKKMIVYPYWILRWIGKGKRRREMLQLVDMKYYCNDCKILSDN